MESRQFLSVAGDLDLTFGGGDGIATEPAGFELGAVTAYLPSGFLAAGSQRFNSVLRMALARYRPDGSLDTTFGVGGFGYTNPGSSNMNLDVQAVVAAPNGKYLVAANAHWNGSGAPEDFSLAVARFDHNGQLDATFGAGGVARLKGIGVMSLAAEPDGKVLVGEGFSVARLTTAGKFDASFGSGDGIASTDFFGSGAAGETDMKLLPDGKVLLVNTASVGNKLGDTDVAVVRYTAAGALDTTFGGGTGKATTNFFQGEPGFSFDFGDALAVRPDGSFVVGGSADDGPWFASYDASGKIVKVAPVAMGEVPTVLTVGKGGKVLAVGGHALARINPDLTLDKAFGPGGGDGDGVVMLPFTGNNVTVVPDGRFYVTGSIDGKFAVARYQADPVAPPPVADGDDQIAEAVTIAVGGSVTKTIGPATDVDVYKFTVKARQWVGFDVDRTAGSTLDSYVRLFNAAGVQVLANNNGFAPGEPTTTKESYVEYTFPAAGTYYLGVSGLANVMYNAVAGTGDTAGSTGGYKLTLTDRTASDPDDQISEAILTSVGSTITGKAISPPGDVDVYRFSVTGGQRVGFDIDKPTGSGLDSYLRLFDASGKQLAANDNAAAPGETPGTASYLSYTFASGGTYYVGVSGVPNWVYDALTGSGDVTGGLTSMGAYALRLAGLS